MTRIPRMPRSGLTGEQAALYDEIAGGPRAAEPRAVPLVGADGALEGPFNAMLVSPGLGRALQELGATVRYRSPLPARIRELAILAVARAQHSAFERRAHEAAGRAAGLTDSEMAGVAAGECPATLGPEEAAALACVQAIARRADLSDAEYAAAVRTLGAEAVFALVTLAGYYSALALQLRVYRVDPAPAGPAGPEPAGNEPACPDKALAQDKPGRVEVTG